MSSTPVAGRSPNRAVWPVAVSFAVVHAWLISLNLFGPGYPLGDVTSVYKFWTEQIIANDYWVGVDSPWVYPIVAIVPMLLAHLPVAFASPGNSTMVYAVSWLLLVTALNSAAFAALLGWGARAIRLRVAWWWTAFLIVLGPIALGRIDSVSVPIAIIGALLIASRPRVAAVVLTLAAWIKVWPGVIVIALVVALKERWRILAVALGVSAGILAFTLSFGSGAHVISFITEQSGRGLEVEAPIATVWMWQAFLGVPGARVFYNDTIYAWEVTGPGADVAASVMTPLLVGVVAVLAILAALAIHRGASSARVLAPLVLALVVALVAFQKVGSPQYISWLAVPVILGLVMCGLVMRERSSPRESFRMPAALVLLIAGLTQLIYPFFFGQLLSLWWPLLVILTVRNLLLFVLLGWALTSITASVFRATAPERAFSAA